MRWRAHGFSSKFWILPHKQHDLHGFSSKNHNNTTEGVLNGGFLPPKITIILKNHHKYYHLGSGLEAPLNHSPDGSIYDDFSKL